MSDDNMNYEFHNDIKVLTAHQSKVEFLFIDLTNLTAYAGFTILGNCSDFRLLMGIQGVNDLLLLVQ